MTDRQQKVPEPLQAQLAHAQKLAAASQLAGGIAHDFNNVLTGILAYADLCQHDLQSPELVAEYLVEITKAAQQAAGLSRRLVTVARQQAMTGGPKYVLIDAHIRELAHLLQRLLGDEIELRLELDAEDQSVALEGSALTQVLVNLIVNARDAVSTGGRVIVRTAAATVAGHASVRLSVIDSGCGISGDVLAHIFEPFFTTKGADHGTGLGLATVHAIATNANGVITARSELGRGTVLELLLPVARGGGQKLVVAPSPAGRAAFTGRVLLVERDGFVGRVLRRTLQGWGFEVCHVREPRAALQRLQAEGGVSLLLCDLGPDQVEATQLVAEARRLDPAAQIIFTGSDASAFSGEDEPAAPCMHLPKPFTPGQLLSCIVRS